jgi:hypothetical protein
MSDSRSQAFNMGLLNFWKVSESLGMDALRSEQGIQYKTRRAGAKKRAE